MVQKSGKCKVALNVEVDGVRYKVVDKKDPCYAVNKVLSKHEGFTLITSEQYHNLLKMKDGVKH